MGLLEQAQLTELLTIRRTREVLYNHGTRVTNRCKTRTR